MKRVKSGRPIRLFGGADPGTNLAGLQLRAASNPDLERKKDPAPALTEIQVAKTFHQKTGLRLTRSRKAVLSAMQTLPKAATSTEIHSTVGDDKIAASTIYRILRELADARVIIRYGAGGKKIAFGLSRSDRYCRLINHHYALIDLESGKAWYEQDAIVEQVMANVAAELGYEISAYRLKLYVRKDDCERSS